MDAPAAPAPAALPPPTPTPPELRVGTSGDCAPLSSLNGAGERTGFDVELAERLEPSALDLGTQVRPALLDLGERIVQALAEVRDSRPRHVLALADLAALEPWLTPRERQRLLAATNAVFAEPGRSP
jgi:hypothetical protein